MTIEGADYNKALFIISDKHEAIRDKIIHDLERGGTYLRGRGMYTNEEKEMIFAIVSRRELAILEEFISDIDPGAFITIMDTKEILGEVSVPGSQNPGKLILRLCLILLILYNRY